MNIIVTTRNNNNPKSASDIIAIRRKVGTYSKNDNIQDNTIFLLMKSKKFNGKKHLLIVECDGD